MAQAPQHSDRPLVVDLDDTLVTTDIFLEQAMALAKRGVGAALGMARALAAGRAEAKRHVARQSTLDPDGLPYNAPVVAFLKAERARGRRIILATAADREVAEPVAAHLGLFDAVLASDETGNLKGARKAEAIAAHLDGQPFDYIGDSPADRPIWQAAGQAHVVAADRGKAGVLAAGVPVVQVFERPGLTPASLIKALRLHQWAKNVLVFVALLLSHTYGDMERVGAAVIAFIALGLCASGTYLWNDLLDLADDRRHPSKRRRPLASGVMTIRQGLVISFGIVALALGLAWVALGPVLVLALICYIVLTVSYSLLIKRKMAADVMLLALLFLFRIYLGGLAIDVPVTDWLLAFSIFFFLSLGYAKRLADLPPEKRTSAAPIAGRAYTGLDAGAITALGVASAFCSVIIMALYITDETVSASYAAPQLLWLICFLLLYWLNRVWLLVYRGLLDDDPVVFALKDNTSRLCGLVIVLVVVLAKLGVG